MNLRPSTAALASFALLAALIAPAQQPAPVAQFTDPANLRGERVKPRDGRELPIDQGARGLEQLLRKLNTRASLMLIVAHPDDEDGGMLTYYSRGLGARVAVLTLTRGEGGQNAMTGDFEDALGLLRTQELLSADRYLGADQFFGTEVDFGFSKTKEEAFKKWTHERVLYDAVRSIRLYRPLVIASVWIGGVTDGHGQHQVSGQIAQEAFKAAADPTVFPDMIAEGILPWQALKVYARVPMQSISDKGLFDYATGKYTAPRFENYVTGEVTTTPPSADVIVHEGTTDPLLSDNPSDPPRSYIQFARIGLGMQKSQIGGGFRVPPAGAFDVAYHRYGSRLAKQPEKETSFFDGIDTSIEGIASLAPQAPPALADYLREIEADIAESQRHLDSNNLEASAPALWDASEKLTKLTYRLGIAPTVASAKTARRPKNAPSVDEFNVESWPMSQRQQVLRELHLKQVQVNGALTIALGLDLDATASSAHSDLIAGSPVSIDVTLTSRSMSPLSVGHLEVFNERGRDVTADPPSGNPKHSLVIHDFFFRPLPQNAPYRRTVSAKGSATAEITRPYFSRPSIEQPTYDLNQPFLRNASLTAPALVAQIAVRYSGRDSEPAELPMGRIVYLSRIVHNNSQPVSIVPPVSVRLSSDAQVAPSTHKSFSFSLTAIPVEKIIGVSSSYGRANGGDGQRIAKPDHGYLPPTSTFTLPLDAGATATVYGSALATDTHTYTEGYRPIGYGDLPRTNYYTPATVRIVPVDLNLPANHRIAYLPGTGDAVPEALSSISLKPDILAVADLTPAKLAQYDTVILGVRTYAAHPELHGAPTQALLDYARSGGNVLVQYQTAEFTAADAPYPLTLGYAAEKVVDETDTVQILDPTAPFLTTPNKITPADFNNWVEERGHGFLGSWNSHYTALTETHDPDQDPQRGGLITTPLGPDPKHQGRWTYCAFALYRQLPEAVPGAFRLFVNLISPTR
jgi:LmbE family N-acetylglucosaminyl deacetylase